jgi:hypothetical protein
MFDFELKLINECHISIVICLNPWKPIGAPNFLYYVCTQVRAWTFLATIPSPMLVHNMDVKSGNGTWSIGGTSKKIPSFVTTIKIQVVVVIEEEEQQEPISSPPLLSP